MSAGLSIGREGPLIGVGSYALVGRAATAAATIHELSGDYSIALPLLLSTVVATWLSRARGGESVYEAELRRRGIGWELTIDGRQIERIVADTSTRP